MMGYLLPVVSWSVLVGLISSDVLAKSEAQHTVTNHQQTIIMIAATTLASTIILFSLDILFSFGSFSEIDSKWWLSASELLLLISTIVLIVGLIGEWRESPSWKKTFLYRIAKASVVVGVVGELLSDGGIFRLSARLQVLEEITIADANTKAAGAMNLAASAISRASEIEKKYAWRRVLPDQKNKILAALVGQKFSMYFEFMPNDPEAGEYADQMFKALRASGLNIYPPHPLVSPPPPRGLTISGSSGADRSSLEKALSDADVPFRTSDEQAGAPRVSVGSRPPPI
jgi:hypothetical protein